MTSAFDLTVALTAFRQRLGAVAPYLLTRLPASSISLGALLAELADAVAEELTDARVWILCTAVAGGYPTSEEVLSVRRALALAAPEERMGAVLSGVANTASAVRSHAIRAEVVTTALVDTDFCAKHAHNTGIQRVVRNTVPRWSDRHQPALVAWSPDRTGYRRLTPRQEEFVLRWRHGLREVPENTNDNTLVIPVGAALVLPEMPNLEVIPRLSALARHSNNRLGLIGYDAIPIVSADSMVDLESERFARYLSIVKYAKTVSCISAATAKEFVGIGSALPAQGLRGPKVFALPLPGVAPSAAERAREKRERPLVLTVGSIEPRKNQLAVLSAARILWERGVDFELMFIGSGSAWFLAGFQHDVAALRRAGHPVSIRTGFTDNQLSAAYHSARLVAFPSLQEGYGLPVAEALAMGTPVVTSGYGSTAEISRQGGCLLVNPRDDDDIANAIGAILTDDVVHDRLVEQISTRNDSSWEQYAEALWEQLTEGRA